MISRIGILVYLYLPVQFIGSAIIEEIHPTGIVSDPQPLLNAEHCAGNLWTGVMQKDASGNIILTENFAPSRDRQFSRRGENSRTIDSHAQSIQVDFGKVVFVSGIKTKVSSPRQRPRYSGVFQFEILYKMDNSDPVFTPVRDEQGGGKTIFYDHEGNNRDKKTIFDDLLRVQVIQVAPTVWTESRLKTSIKLTLLGCYLKNPQQSGCGGLRIHTNPTGFLSSMNYPHKYNNNANCEWDIIAPDGQVVLLNFENEISIEEVSYCMMEYVEIIDVVDEQEKSLARHCGEHQPGLYSSTANHLKVRFKTDHYETYTGFRVNYYFTNSSGCGGPQLLMQDVGTFSYRSSNKNNRDECRWDIIVGKGNLIEMEFHKEGSKVNSSSDSRDVVQITDEADQGGRVNVLFPIASSSPYISAGANITVRFSTTDNIPNEDFVVTYNSVVASGCGGRQNLDGPSGQFQSINHPNQYDVDTTCEWNITSDENHIIELTFQSFRLEGDRDCRFDYVDIFAGPLEKDLLGKYCGTKEFSSAIVSKTGMMRVVFVSDKINVHSGFKATYTVRNLEQETTTVTSTTAIPEMTHAMKNSIPASSLSPRASAETDSTRLPNTVFSSAANRGENLVTKIPKELTTDLPSTTKPRKRPTIRSPPIGTVTEEMVKWIIVVLASVSGLLVLLVFFGVIICCKQNFMEVLGLHKRNQNDMSSIVQNYAYDFSIGSTNHSIRSKQVDQHESSQISESISRQGTLRRSNSRDSHIYFSIEECSKRKNKDSKEDQVDRKMTNQSVKVHFRPNCQNYEGEGEDNQPSGESSSVFITDAEDQSEKSKQNDNYEELSDERELESENSKVKEKMPNLQSNNEEQKRVVDNILYISTNIVK